MAEPFILIIAAALAVTATVAVVCWHKILSWAEESLFPWVRANFPALEQPVRDAFVILDNVTVAVREATK
ncbi:MAG: hypothetical protein ETSY1_34400 [Candidatus Entotheonella factor]|uniref:Uncharacterized protein n=1 Tax=Entotheonella factor TaxID=1429438 RepID=W4L9F9_ENTF1|nr:MAG: hypothetical protein ETSY1_34400 [Candidatus Entotheonella factor]